MPERYHYHPSQDAQDARRAVEQHFRWTDPQQPYRYAPSADQVLQDEATTELARRSADSFVLGLVQAVAPPDDQTPLLLTADEVRARYKLHTSERDDSDAAPFTLREAWASAERQRRHAQELARAT